MRKCKVLCAFLALLMIISSLFVLSSCHGGYALPVFEIPENYDPDTEVEITFWAKNENNKEQQEVYRQAVSSFQELYPNIHVNLKLYSDYNDIYKDVITNISTATTPNVCITYPDHIATYKTGNNVIVPLNSLIDDEEWGLGSENLKFTAPTKDQMVSQFLEEGVIDGVQYAIPYMRSTEACYINLDLLHQVQGYEEYVLPEYITWDFVFEVSKAAMAMGKDGGVYNLNGQEVLIPFIYKSTDNMMIQMLEQAEAGYSTSDSEVLIFNDTTDEILLQIADLVKHGAFSTFKISSYPGNYFNKGQCIFAIDSTAGATWMGPEATELDIKEEEVVDFKMEIRAIPQYDTENPKMISQGPSICIFNKEDINEVMASWLFVQYLLTNEVQISYSKTEGYVPVTALAQNSDEYKEYLSLSGTDKVEHYYGKIEAAQILLENLDNTFVTPVFNGSANLRNAAGQMIEEVCKGVRRKKTVDAAFLKELYADMTSLYHLDDFNLKSGTKEEFSGIPKASVILIVSLALIWLLLGAFTLIKFILKKKSEKGGK